MPHPKAYRALATELEDSELATTVASVRPPKAMLFTCSHRRTFPGWMLHHHMQTQLSELFPFCHVFPDAAKLPGSFANFRLDLEYIAWLTLQHSCVCASRIIDTLRAEM